VAKTGVRIGSRDAVHPHGPTARPTRMSKRAWGWQGESFAARMRGNGRGEMLRGRRSGLWRLPRGDECPSSAAGRLRGAMRWIACRRAAGDRRADLKKPSKPSAFGKRRARRVLGIGNPPLLPSKYTAHRQDGGGRDTKRYRGVVLRTRPAPGKIAGARRPGSAVSPIAVSDCRARRPFAQPGNLTHPPRKRTKQNRPSALSPLP